MYNRGKAQKYCGGEPGMIEHGLLTKLKSPPIASLACHLTGVLI